MSSVDSSRVSKQTHICMVAAWHSSDKYYHDLPPKRALRAKKGPAQSDTDPRGGQHQDTQDALRSRLRLAAQAGPFRSVQGA